MILQKLKKVVSSAFEDCGYDKSFGVVLKSARPDLCQFQCNGAFICAKQYKKSPVSIAREVSTILIKNRIFRSVEVISPGFLNLTVTDEFIVKCVNEIMNDKYLGIPQYNETIVLDYGGPNVAKPLHIGHLRAAIIGESLKRIARSMGRTVISDVHLGDWGLQIGLVIAELEKRNPNWACFSTNFDPQCDKIEPLNINDLSEIYPLASKKSKEDNNFKKRAKDITADLQNGHAGYTSLWKEIMRVSVNDIKANYDKLNVEFDLWYGESDADKYIPQLLKILENQGVIYESDGAMVVDVEKEDDKTPIPPIIIKKSDNSYMYSTTDLATIIQRESDFNPDYIWYVVDNRQKLHFTQVFRCAQNTNLTDAKLEHLGFGTMNGSNGKPYKTRDGGVMQLSDFIETVFTAVKEKIEESSFISNNYKLDAAEKIAIAAIKFGDLSNHRLKDYVFDIDNFISFEGKTGVYLLYTISRINSILKKMNYSIDSIATIYVEKIYTDIEREIFLNILLTSDEFLNAFTERAPNVICDNVYKLASLFSTFYHDNLIMSEKDINKKNAWLLVCVIVRIMLIKQLEILGIDTVDSM